MKKLFVIVGLLFMVFTARAQTELESGFIVRAGVGMNFNGVNKSYMSDKTPTVGYNVGATYRKWMTKTVGFEAGLIFERESYKMGLEYQPDYPGSNFVSEGRNVKMNYLSVPALVRFNTYKGLNLFVGPELGLLVGSKTDRNGVTSNSGSLYHDACLSVRAGVGYQFSCGVDVNLEYMRSLTNTAVILYGALNPKIHRQTLSLTVGYMF